MVGTKTQSEYWTGAVLCSDWEFAGSQVGCANIFWSLRKLKNLSKVGEFGSCGVCEIILSATWSYSIGEFGICEVREVYFLDYKLEL